MAAIKIITFKSSDDKVCNCLKITPLEEQYAEKLYGRLNQINAHFSRDYTNGSVYLVFPNNNCLEEAERLISEFDVASGNEIEVEELFCPCPIFDLSGKVIYE